MDSALTSTSKTDKGILYRSAGDELNKNLEEAIKKNNRYLMNKLLTNAGHTVLTYKIYFFGTLLHMAAAAGNAQMCQYLIEAGIDIEEIDRDDHTALSIAANNPNKKKTLDVVTTLLSAGAKTNIEVGSKLLLEFYMDKRHFQCVKLLVEHGAGVNHALQRALSLKQDNRILLLLDNNVKPKSDSILWSYLDSIRNYDKKYPVIKKLLECGADPNMKLNKMRNTIFHKLLKKASLNVVTLFIEHGAHVGTIFKGRAERVAAEKNKDRRVYDFIVKTQSANQKIIEKEEMD